MSAARTWASSIAAALLLGGMAASATGCTTEAFCFDDCIVEKAGTEGGTSGQGGSGGFTLTTSGEGGCFLDCSTGSTGAGGCEPTNGGIEICDGIDNDCNTVMDDIPGLDLGGVQTCGTCAHSCLVDLQNCAIDGIQCVPSSDPGNVPGECKCNKCAADYHDNDADPKTCEYYCVGVAGATDDTTCDNVDDDCDGVKDEDVDLCTSTTDCGTCGHNCVTLHGTPECVNSQLPCTAANTQCQIQACDCNGVGDCWWDLDNSVATGCEYQCDITNGGVEICDDGLDNDCDGKLDGADDLSMDPEIGVQCFGDPDGECATIAHAGVTACQGSQVVCLGPNVQVENQVLETCNAKDDDCDGVTDDSPTDVGAACGISNVFPCSLGSQQCVGGVLTCLGQNDPQVETCNGQDDNCDNVVDKTGNNPPADSVGACNVPVPPPAGATSPCVAGAKACVTGVVVCQGSVGPSSPSDTCGVDANCDGALTNQPNTQTDVANCGMCGINCAAGAVHANWGCAAGACQFLGCQTGYFDLNNDQKCEYACAFISPTELCNGVDDNCNGTIDEGVVTPSPVQVCGVSPSATATECTSGVAVACQNGSWKCTFPMGVCNPSCATPGIEICDTLDNDCDGALNENVANFNKPCASDDGLPPPGDGACRTTGTFQCTGPNVTACNAVKAPCAGLPGGCTELCDGVDNDCDGLVDETFNAKGSNAANFVKPTVTKLAAALWIYTYEASRPTATNVVPGTGNGYRCIGAGCAGVPSAPAGVTLDKTPACSSPTKIPWFNVDAIQVEQTCQAMGGAVCTTASWQTACKPNVACKWGYNPRGAAGSACATPFVAGSKFCNLGSTFDFAPGTPGDQDGLLPTASASLQNCWGDWSALQGNVATTSKLFDITGNLREVTKFAANQYKLMGGAFDSASEDGSSCDFTFYTVDQNFKLFDAGFRCCFTADPTM